ncbi:AraC family transcriptional regulator [Pseudomonas sp. FW300-N1A1]|uniref:helix-turn-helix transcriptional regulator n=1 Tax=Pseudomonas sp. FW300-N1A1 TaxID=2075555 RepID=UPI000CD09C7C|nr:helix-turn-helix transcriptional regulator [Pseudomonas sp. FW300-N1A1]POA21878.1 AraC family transcriptional regulator [Pseudomonas sp. FW300-N1A1]
MNSFAPPRFLELESAPLDELSGRKDHWDIDLSSVEQVALIQRFRHIRGPQLRHSRFDFNACVTAVGAIPDGFVTFAISRLTAGRPTWNNQRLQPNEIVVLHGGESVHYRCEPNEALFTVTTTLEHYEVCRERHGAIDLLKARKEHRYQAESHQPIRSAFKLIGDSLAALSPPTLASRHPGWNSQWESTVLGALLQALTPDQPKIRDVPTRRKVAARAIEYIHEHAHKPITLLGLAEKLNTTGRSLHQGFIESFGTTPMAYLRNIRLSNARQDLIRHTWPSVTETAMHWNFFHLGRFSKDYQHAYGEAPSHTYRRHPLTP